jgi:UDP-N-acetylmuramoyl-L-alanyl-D-glutamate--2,6-diaminopimelate ligase
MTLAELLRGTEILQFTGDSGVEVSALAYDSRRAQRGGIFFAIEGAQADGHRFLEDVLRAGVRCVVSERPAPASFPATWVQVPKIRRALADFSRVFFGLSGHSIRLIGITGTNGKTTTAFLIHSILEACGTKAGMLGTIAYYLGDRSIPASHTTPESLDLAEYLTEIRRQGGEAAVLEVSSHALAQERVWGFRFEAAVFTNLTGDHLDYHKDLETYFKAKARLFEGEGAPAPELGVINLDDPRGERLLKLLQPRQITYGINSHAQVRPAQFSLSLEGIRAAIDTPEGRFECAAPLLGRANLANILAAAATAWGLGIDGESIKEGIRRLKNVPGRMERVDEGQPFMVFVDYAHTHDALMNALEALRGFTRRRLLLVFGCGGERDRTKRPLMGEVAGRLSDWVALTSDNPRAEDPFLIMNDVMVGLQKYDTEYVAEVDRAVAIRRALEEATEGDVVLLAGKGHETVQVLKNQRVHSDDREIAREVLRELGFKGRGK